MRIIAGIRWWRGFSAVILPWGQSHRFIPISHGLRQFDPIRDFSEILDGSGFVLAGVLLRGWGLADGVDDEFVVLVQFGADLVWAT